VKKYLYISSITSVSLMLISGMAQAAGFALTEQSGSSIGNAFAGAGSAAEDASIMLSNPAGL
jgi:long-chain fatty acid transport protein